MGFKTIVFAQIIFLTLFSNILFAGNEKKEEKKFKKLRIDIVRPLDFGKVVLSEFSNSIIIMNPVNGNRRIINGISIGGDYSFAEFEITGDSDEKFVIIFPAYITLYRDGKTVTVSNLTGYFPHSRKSNSGSSRIVEQLKDGKIKLLMGGTVIISYNNDGGKMSGTSNIIVRYCFLGMDNCHN